uniref:Uncharacterized protein n=1 Tax=Candidozyma auris TaxID=498019 RepID=A0A0L0P5V4_CANAR
MLLATERLCSGLEYKSWGWVGWFKLRFVTDESADTGISGGDVTAESLLRDSDAADGSLMG